MKRVCQLFFFLILSLSMQAQDTNSLQEKIRGSWYQPHDFEILEAIIDINFQADGTFVFNCYNEKTGKVEKLTGKYKTKGKDVIILYYSDGKKEKMTYKANVPVQCGTFDFILSKRHGLRLIRP